jgi:hypothetical protein
MTTRTGFSKEQERSGAAENQKCLASCPETACRSSLDACFYKRVVVVCRNFLRAQQDVGDLWLPAHRHDNASNEHGGKQYRRDPNAMTPINWSIMLIELPQSSRQEGACAQSFSAIKTKSARILIEAGPTPRQS